jgi:hypothetical protein
VVKKACVVATYDSPSDTPPHPGTFENFPVSRAL